MAYSLVRSRHELGQLVFFDSAYRHRWVDAIGPNVIKYLNDFAGDDEGTEGWIETNTAGTCGVSVVNGDAGAILLYTSGDDGDGYNLNRFTGIRLSINDPVYFGVRWKFSGSAAGSVSVAMGLTAADTDACGGIADGMAFVSPSANTSLYLQGALNSTLTRSSACTLAADTYYIDEFYFNGASTTAATTVKHWHDGVYIGALSNGSICGDEVLMPTLSVEDEAGNASATSGLTVDWIRMIQLLGSR